MSQTLDPVPNEESDRILCSYINLTSQIQVARITNVPNWYFERVVFPGQRLVFESLAFGILEIHTGMMASAIMSDSIPCDRLIVGDSGDPGSQNVRRSPSLSNISNPKTSQVLRQKVRS